MNKILIFLMLGSLSINLAFADDELTGDTKYACEAILCLSSSTRPSECMPSLRKYFSISAKKAWKTIAKRKSFLKLCPMSDGSEVDQLMETLVSDQSVMQTDCTAEALNKIVESKTESCGSDCIPTTYYRTKPTIPAYCEAIAKHTYTDITLPTYHCNQSWYTARNWNKISPSSSQKICWKDAITN